MRTADFKEEIIEMYSEGMGSRRIGKALKAKYGDNFSQNLERNIRSICSKHKSGLPKGVAKQMEDRGFNTEQDWSIAWIKPDKGLSVLVRNPNRGINSPVDLDQVREEFVAEMKEYAPDFEKIKYKRHKEPHCLIVDIADLHIGKLGTDAGTGETYNVEKAINRAKSGVKGILKKSSGFDIGQIVFVIGNDVLHTDNMHSNTTKGTPQDTDGMWYDNFKIARALYVSIIESLSTIAPVHVVHCPSNHDFISGFMLADSVYSWFHKCKSVTFDVSNRHRKYYKYGQSLMMFEHGDGAKFERLPMIMAEEAKQDWADTTYRYIYLHHLHQNKKLFTRVSQDFPGVNIQYLRTPSGTDQWHHRNGYQHGFKAVEGFVHSPDHGQCAHLTHYFNTPNGESSK